MDHQIQVKIMPVAHVPKIKSKFLLVFITHTLMLSIVYWSDITNTGDSEMVLLLWANETFDREKPDTYFLKV